MSTKRALPGVALAAAAAAVAAIMFAPAASAQGVIGDWSSVRAPHAPALKSVTVDPHTTALLVMDFGQFLCNDKRVARCLNVIPKVRELLDKARAHGMLVIYTGFPLRGGFKFVADIEPTHGEPVVLGHADKFQGTRLNAMLKAHGIKTVITTGVVANGAVLFTAFGAAGHGYKVIVPVDTMPGVSPYAEQSTIWQIANDPGLGPRVATLTSVDMINF